MLSLTLRNHADWSCGCLQNASLSVMTQNQIWSMHSTDDSLWGDDDVVPPLDEDTSQPPETWLMLEFCDRGSLLVSLCSNLTSQLALLFAKLLHLCLLCVGYKQKWLRPKS